MSVSEKVAAAFDEAARMQPDLRTSWLRVSVCLGGALPASTLMSSVQRDGELDLVLRCMEDERTMEPRAGHKDYPNLHLSKCFQKCGSEAYMKPCASWSAKAQ